MLIWVSDYNETMKINCYLLLLCSFFSFGSNLKNYFEKNTETITINLVSEYVFYQSYFS